MKSIRDIAVHHQTVFLRVDFNVPLNKDKEGNVREDARIKAALPTIEYLIEKQAKIVIGSHLGRPAGERNMKYSLQPVAKRLSELLGQEIHFAADCIGDQVNRMKADLQPGEIILLENLRFYAQEEDNDLKFAEQLAEGIDVFVCDGFGVIHRKHASVYALPSLVFDKAMGFLIEQEVDALNKVIHDPDQPLVVAIGGVKISDKVDVIRGLAEIADVVLVGGGVANTFLKGLGNDIGASIVDSDSVDKSKSGTNFCDVAQQIYKQFETEQSTIEAQGMAAGKIQLPLDFIAAPTADEGAETKIITVGVDAVPEGWRFLDIGPRTRALYSEVLKKARTIFWNGPMGLFEMDAYASGSRDVATAIAESSAYTVLGGGDTEAMIQKFGLGGRYSHVSTGGGASLTYLAQEKLPGLTALE